MRHISLLYRCIILFAPVLSSFARAQTSFSPASIPLAVRSPYLSTWLINTNGSQPISEAWAMPWDQPVCLFPCRICVISVENSLLWNVGTSRGMEREDKDRRFDVHLDGTRPRLSQCQRHEHSTHSHAIYLHDADRRNEPYSHLLVPYRGKWSRFL